MGDVVNGWQWNRVKNGVLDEILAIFFFVVGTFGVESVWVYMVMS